MAKDLTPIQVNYKNIKPYDMSKPPLRQYAFWVHLIRLLSFFATLGLKKKVERINLKGLKPPYFMLSNHMHFVDFELVSLATRNHKVNNVVNLDGFYKRAWLLKLIGSIPTRKFTSDLYLIKSISKVIKRGDVLGMYPEARYSPIGTTSYIPEAVAKLVKMNKCPVVAIIHRGNYLRAPAWEFRRKRKVPLHTTATQILTKEQVMSMSAQEINEVIQKAFVYDEYKYQKENGILIKEKFRAEGLHRVLYKCPHCGSEEHMSSKGSILYCDKCHKEWNLNEDGTLSALTGETEFSHIPSWFEWQREQVKQEIINGTYSYEDSVDVYSMPRTNKFIKLGNASIAHNFENGFVLEGNYNNADYRIIREPIQSVGLHVEYDYFRIKRDDCFVINTENDSFFCYPTKRQIVTKLYLAVEEMYKLKLEEIKKNK